jgi:AcrR family transcriptional regulator
MIILEKRTAMRTKNPGLHRRRRAAILAAAGRCFVAKGFHQTSMQDICAAAAMSPGALYRYFSSKKAIIAGMVEQERADNRALLARIGEAPNLMASLDEVLRRLTPLFFDRANALLTLEVVAEGARNADIAALISAADTEARALLEATLTRARDGGELRADVDIRAAAYLVLALIDGLMGRGALGPPLGAKKFRAALADLLARWLAAEPSAPRTAKRLAASGGAPPKR